VWKQSQLFKELVGGYVRSAQHHTAVVIAHVPKKISSLHLVVICCKFSRSTHKVGVGGGDKRMDGPLELANFLFGIVGDLSSSEKVIKINGVHWCSSRSLVPLFLMLQH
jgi:hypothetical protein